MSDERYRNNSGSQEIYLTFTQPHIYKAIEEIKNYAMESKCIITDEIDVDEDVQNNEYDDITLTLTIPEEINRKIAESYGQIKTNHINIWWTRKENSKRYWYVNRAGRRLCEKEFVDNLFGEETNNKKCYCPSEFKEFCGNITSVLKKYSLEKK